MRIKPVTALAVTGLGAAAFLGLAACGPATVAKAPPAPSSSAPAAPAATTAPAPVPSDTPVTTGPLGTSFTITTTDSSGAATVYTVALTEIVQHATLTQYETLQNPADHMAAARFSVTGVTGQSSDDANNDAAATGNDTVGYSPSFLPVTDAPNFSYGTFRVGPGQTVSGDVTFEVPPGTVLASVSWSPGFDGASATWNLAG